MLAKWPIALNAALAALPTWYAPTSYVFFFLFHAVIVHESRDPHHELLRGRHQAIRNGVGARSCDMRSARSLTEPTELALSQRPKHHDTLGLPCGDRGCRVGNRPGGSPSTATPLHQCHPQIVHVERSCET